MRIDTVEGMLIGSDLVGANYVVRITTDSGLTGLGQSGAWGFPDAVAKVVEQYAEYLVGKDPFRIEHIQQSLSRLRPFRGNVVSSALSAVDIALWDIKAKHFEVPVWELLGGRYRDRVRLHLLIDGSTPQAIAARCQRCRRRRLQRHQVRSLPERLPGHDAGCRHRGRARHGGRGA